jgi:hypothetical protein
MGNWVSTQKNDTRFKITVSIHLINVNIENLQLLIKINHTLWLTNYAGYDNLHSYYNSYCVVSASRSY